MRSTKTYPQLQLGPSLSLHITILDRQATAMSELPAQILLYPVINSNLSLKPLTVKVHSTPSYSGLCRINTG